MGKAVDVSRANDFAIRDASALANDRALRVWAGGAAGHFSDGAPSALRKGARRPDGTLPTLARVERGRVKMVAVATLRQRCDCAISVLVVTVGCGGSTPLGASEPKRGAVEPNQPQQAILLDDSKNVCPEVADPDDGNLDVDGCPRGKPQNPESPGR
jgi:hypothetical protein